MTHHYNATFSPVMLALPEILARVEPALLEFGANFDGEVFRLASVGGAPGVESGQEIRSTSMDEVAQTAARWWGVSLAWVSHEIGEIYVAIFPSPAGGMHVQYNEGRSTFGRRRADGAFADELVALLLRLASALGAEVCIYEMEEDGVLARVMPDSVVANLRKPAAPSQFPEVLLIAKQLLSLDVARRDAPPGVQVNESTAGYIVLRRI